MPLEIKSKSVSSLPIKNPSLPIKKKEIGVSYGEHLTAKPIIAHTTHETKIKGIEMPSGGTESETLHPGVFGTGLSITVDGGRTLNLGNFESSRIGVSITVPCAPENLEEAYDWATTWISDKINTATSEAKGE